MAALPEDSLSPPPLPTGAKSKVQDFQKLAGSQGDPAASPPLLFAWLSTSGLLLVPESESTAGWPSPDPGEPQERLRRGNANHRQRRVNHCLSVVVRAQRKVRWDPGQICWEKTRNKHLANSYSWLFIKGVWFVFVLTSYIDNRAKITHNSLKICNILEGLVRQRIVHV